MARALVRLLNRGGISVMLLDEEVYAAALELFEQRAETLSLRDAASLQLMKKLGIQRLASYDEKRSFSGAPAEVVGKGYFESLDETRKKLIRALDRARAAR
jgi:predicted nucleic acid-binding protein